LNFAAGWQRKNPHQPITFYLCICITPELYNGFQNSARVSAQRRNEISPVAIPFMEILGIFFAVRNGFALHEPWIKISEIELKLGKQWITCV